MKIRLIKGLKDGLFVFIGVVLIALILNFIDFNFGENRIWTILGDLNLINIFENEQLNGLIILGVVLGIFAFALGFSFQDKEKNKK